MIGAPSRRYATKVSTRDTDYDKLSEKFSLFSFRDSGVPKEKLSSCESNDPRNLKFSSENSKFNQNSKSKSKSNFESNRIKGLNTVPTAFHANNELFNMDDALDEENLEMGAVRGKAEVEGNEEAAEPSDKAVKSDDAKVPCIFGMIVSQLSLHFIGRKRVFGQRGGISGGINPEKTKVIKSFIRWYEEEGRHLPNAGGIWESGMVVVQCAEACTWWNWNRGFKIVFWRWPKWYQEIARQGHSPMFVGPPPTAKVPQPPYDDEEIRQKVKEKIQRVIDNGYIELRDTEEVESLMYYFHVPKGEEDIQMVYDGSKSGLNESVFEPWFNLPSSETMARWVLVGSWLGDNDFEDCWLNHELHPSL